MTRPGALVLSLGSWPTLSSLTKLWKCFFNSSSRVSSVNKVYLPSVRTLLDPKDLLYSESFWLVPDPLATPEPSPALSTCFYNNFIALFLKAFALFYDILVMRHVFLLCSMLFSAGPLSLQKCYFLQASLF